MHVETDLDPLGVQVYPHLEKQRGRGGCHHMTVTVYLAWNYSQAKPDPHARAHLARMSIMIEWRKHKTVIL